MNTLTNCCSYDVIGEVVDIQTIAIDPASKKTAEEDILEHAPHPIRGSARRKVMQKEADRKSKDQLLEELNILNNLFSIGGDEKKEVPYQEVLDVVGLKDNADYNDLWDQIMQELALEQGKIYSLKKNKGFQDKSDQELVEAIGQIIS